MIPVSECLSEDGSVCGWYGMCSSKGVRMCQIKGKDRQDTISQRIKFAEGCLNGEQTEALNGLLDAISQKGTIPPKGNDTQLIKRKGGFKKMAKEYKDLRLEPTERKEEVYKLIDGLIKLDIPMSIKEDKRGFPGVFVDCGGVHILTDILSLEQWWTKQRQESKEILEIRILTADEFRQIADIMDNPDLPEGTEHNPNMLIRPKMFTAPAGKVTLEVYFKRKEEKVGIPEKDPTENATNNEAL